jgi:hypothetical protein
MMYMMFVGAYFVVCAGLPETVMANRKFERGKQTKKDAAALAAEREKEYEEYLASDEGKQTEAVLQEYREKRGPSLMDRHLDEGGGSKKAKVQDTRFFDRDRVRTLLFFVITCAYRAVCCRIFCLIRKWIAVRWKN